MKDGIFGMLTDRSVRPAEVGRLVESFGFESLFLPEHTHIPVDAHINHPTGSLPDPHKRTLDPLVALATVAAVTDDLKVATGISLAAQHHPITLAKAFASLDFVSRGRVIVGVGAGWLREEVVNHGVDPSRRMEVLCEHVNAMRAVWTHDEAEFHGGYVDFDPIISYPKPVQKPHPEILVGGSHPNAAARARRLAAGWMPNLLRIGQDRLGSVLREARQEGEEDAVPVTLFRADHSPKALEHYRQIGVSRCVFSLEMGDRRELEESLGSLRQVLDRVGTREAP